MVGYWIPVEKPPHPSEISGISTFAEGIIQTLRQTAYANEELYKTLRPPQHNNWFRQSGRNNSELMQLEFNYTPRTIPNNSYGFSQNDQQFPDTIMEHEFISSENFNYCSHPPENRTLQTNPWYETMHNERRFPATQNSNISIIHNGKSDCLTGQSTLNYVPRSIFEKPIITTTNSNMANRAILENIDSVNGGSLETHKKVFSTNCNNNYSSQSKISMAQSRISDSFQIEKNYNKETGPKQNLVKDFNFFNAEKNIQTESRSKVTLDFDSRIDVFTSKIKGKLEKFKAIETIQDPSNVGKFTEKDEEVDLFDFEMDSPLLKAVERAEHNKTILKDVIENNEEAEEYQKKVLQVTETRKEKEIVNPQSMSDKEFSKNQQKEKRKIPEEISDAEKLKENIPLTNSLSSNKRKKLQTPIKKKLVQTKLFDNKKLSEIIDLNKCSLKDLESQMNYCTPLEICFTFEFNNGTTQLSNPDYSGPYKSILIRIMWQKDNIEICSIGSELWKLEKQSVANFFHTILNTKSSLICLESAELLLFLIQKFKYGRELTLNWRIFDPLIAYWLLEPENPCNRFDSLIEQLKPKSKSCSDFTSSTCKHFNQLSEAFNELKKRLKEENLWDIYYNMEIKLTPILARMSQRGLQVDEKELGKIGTTISRRLSTLEAEAQKLAGIPILLTSAVQLRRVLFDDLKLDQKINLQVKETTTLGVKSTSEAVLKQLVAVHPLPNIILEYRRLHKLKSTFVDGILSFVKKGAVHTIWEQRSAATGRLASSNPNLQSIPKQWIAVNDSTNHVKEINIRSAFSARKGYKFLLADFQQIELRLFAHLSQDPSLVDIFLKSDDVFYTLAERWLGKDGKVMTEKDREKTKRIVYAVMYGAGPSKLVEFLNIPLNDATIIYNEFCANFPIMKKFAKQVTEKCVVDGKLCTVMGRVRKFVNINDSNFTLKAQAERQALNFIIQGAAADICKQAMLQCENEILKANPPLDVHLILQIHDELIWEVPENNLLQFKGIVKQTMENCLDLNGTPLNLSVPIRIKIYEQFSWAPERKNEDIL